MFIEVNDEAHLTAEQKLRFDIMKMYMEHGNIDISDTQKIGVFFAVVGAAARFIRTNCAMASVIDLEDMYKKFEEAYDEEDGPEKPHKKINMNVILAPWGPISHRD